MTVITGVIAPFRSEVARLVNTTGLATYTYLPDDPGHLPCYVVGRPSIREGLTSGVMLMSVDVTLLGRRISDEDSQAELDAYGDQLFTVLGGTRNVKVDGTYLRCELLLPATVIVAGMEFPAYIATVSTETLTC